MGIEKKIDKYLNEKRKKLTLKQNIKKKINTKLTRLDNYHDKIPLKDIQDILEQFDIIILQEDFTKWSGFLMGKEGQEYFDIGPENSYDGRFYQPYDNISLALSWYTMPSGKYEIVTYLT